MDVGAGAFRRRDSRISCTGDAVTFSGIDTNGDPLTPLASTPNADAARASFFANLLGVGTETFETRSGSGPLTINFGAAGTATLSGSGGVDQVTPGTTDSNNSGRYSVPSATTSRFWNTQAGAGGIVLTFSAPVAAFGFYGIDIGDFNGTVNLRLTDTSNVTSSLAVPSASGSPADGSVLYFGFIDIATQYTSIAFLTASAAGQAVDFFAFDDFSVGGLGQIVVPTPAVAEPMSLALFGLGLAGLGLVSRRR